MKSCATKAEVVKENTLLRAQLAECQEVLRAIRRGEVDAFFVDGDQGECVLTLAGTELVHRALVEAMNEGAAIVNEKGIVTYCNGRLSALLHAPLQTVMGALFHRFLLPADRKPVSTLLDDGKADSSSIDITLERADGSRTPVQLSVSPMRIAGLVSHCLVVTDLTARNQAKEELRSLSLCDDLTGLCNRRGFLALAQQQLAVSRRLKSEVVLVFLDLDGFKAINDRLGHLSGDHALADFAGLLKNTFRESDILARLGGDEFAVLALGAAEMKMNTAAMAARLRARLDAFNASGGRPYRLAASAGMVRCEPESTLPIAELLDQADEAMYKQKRLRHKAQADAVR